jgi:hypothetical protein
LKKYIVIQGAVLEEFSQHVNERIKEGYVPIGGVHVITFYPDNKNYTQKQYSQAMIIDQPEE